MSFTDIVLFGCMGIMVLTALYACFSRDLFRSSIALFLETCALAAILLSKNYDFLAAFLVLASVLTAVLLASFGKVINGDLKNLDESAPTLPAKICGPLLGLFTGGVLARELLAVYEIRFGAQAPVETAGPDIFKLGQAMTGDHALSFLCFAAAALVLALGLVLLLRQSANGGSDNG